MLQTTINKHFFISDKVLKLVNNKRKYPPLINFLIILVKV